MTLGQKQRHFTRLIGLLIEWAYQHWYQDYSGKDFKNLKGFAFLIHPCKGL